MCICCISTHHVCTAPHEAAAVDERPEMPSVMASLASHPDSGVLRMQLKLLMRQAAVNPAAAAMLSATLQPSQCTKHQDSGLSCRCRRPVNLLTLVQSARPETSSSG